MRKPNILFILTDDQRYDTIAALGNEDIITPNLDELVRNGVSFTNAYIQGGLHPAVCMPSRAMLHTGRSLFDLEGNGESIPESHTLMGEHLKSNGYTSFGTGKWHNGPPSYTRSFSSGENAFFGGMWDHWNMPSCRYDETGAYDNVINFVINFWRSNEVTQIHCDQFNPGVHSTTLLTDSTVRFIEQADVNQPFFAYTAYLAPHDPRTMPPEYLALYENKELNLTPNVMPEHPFAFGVEKIRDELLIDSPKSEESIRHELKEYYAMITHLDDEIGRVIQALKDKGVYENTIIVLCGDNGLAVGQHGLMGKQNNYEHSIKVPLIFSGPSIPKNQTITQCVYLYDVFPTICDLLGIEMPESVTGRSFLKMFRDPDFQTREKMYYAFGDKVRSCRVGEFKLVEYRLAPNETQLFNLAEDPFELTNVLNDENYRDKAQQMRNELLALAGDYGDKLRF